MVPFFDFDGNRFVVQPGSNSFVSIGRLSQEAGFAVLSLSYDVRFLAKSVTSVVAPFLALVLEAIAGISVALAASPQSEIAFYRLGPRDLRWIADREEPDAITVVAKRIGLSDKAAATILEWRASFRLSARAIWAQRPDDWDDGRRKGKAVARLRADLDRREMRLLGERRYMENATADSNWPRV